MGDPYGKLYKALEAYADKGTQGPNKLKTYETMLKMRSMLAKHLKRINYAYLRSVFFPEFAKGARYPSKFPIVSNTFTVKSTFTVKVGDNSNSMGIVINPEVVSNTLPAMYAFNQNDCTLDNWGSGTPLLFSGKPTTMDSGSGNNHSADLYFQKYRLIGASVTVNPVNHTGGLLRGGVEYDVQLNKLRAEDKYDDPVKFMEVFASQSYDFYRAFKRAEVIINAFMTWLVNTAGGNAGDAPIAGGGKLPDGTNIRGKLFANYVNTYLGVGVSIVDDALVTRSENNRKTWGEASHPNPRLFHPLKMSR